MGFSGMTLLNEPIAQISYDAAARMLYEGRNLSRAALLSGGGDAGQL